ncbi:MAG: hypothetical protein RLZZ241_216 [Bacteroidota bacterium]
MEIKKILTHFFVVAFFALGAVVYFYPVLQGKTIYQSDIVQYRGMAREQELFRARTGQEPYWTNSAFGGMPTYQLGAHYPHAYVKALDRIIRFLPRPADYLFLYFLSFYILMCCLGIESRMAIIGALAFGFSTYLIIILGVGHNAKAHAIGYLPMLLAGILLVFRNKWIWGFVLTALGMALEVQANHYQMTFYFMLLVLVLGITYFIDALRKGTLSNFIKASGIIALGLLLGVMANATSILATREYADWSTRGPAILTQDPNGNPLEREDGLEREYITQYSSGILESLNLLVPRIFGGGSVEAMGSDSKTYDFLIQQGVPRSQALEFSDNLQLYWGDQPGVAAPPYVGAVMLFLFVLGLLLVKDRSRWWLLFGSLLALALSWGKNFSLFTDFMIDYFPLYNKFRAVTSIQIILELCVPILAVLGLKAFFDTQRNPAKTKRVLGIVLGSFSVLVVLMWLVGNTLNFAGGNDAILEQYFGADLVAMIRSDREAVFFSDTLRTFIYILLTAGILWLHSQNRLSKHIALLGITVLVVFDLVGIDRRYVNQEDFVASRRMNAPIAESKADQIILRDTTVFRVLNLEEGLNGARTSYFHHSVGGYHAAKPRRLQDLFEYQVYRDNRQVLNMLNVKYLIQTDESGTPAVSVNPDALGNAWFVSKLVSASNADAEMRALDSLSVANEAVYDASEFPRLSAVEFIVSEAANAQLISYEPNYLKYKTNNSNPGLLVLSEMYYPKGWQVFIDNAPASHFRVNYALRGLMVPSGNHTLEFRFVPEVISQGSIWTLVGSFGLLLAVLGALIYHFRGNAQQKNSE